MSHPDPRPSDTSSRPRVLLVEDNDAACKGLARLLETQGFAVTTVLNGTSALQLLQAGPPFDFLLTDLSLPDLDGREIARTAREQSAIPHIALITGWDLDPDFSSYARWGIDWVFTKPIDCQELLTTLRRASDSKPGPDDSAPGTP